MRRLFLALALVLATLPARASDEAALVAALKGGDHVLLLRHALAPGTGDPANFDVADCATQRNLSDEGRRQARAIGAWLRGRGVAVDVVHSSPWCRCLDTARLMSMGPVEAHPGLASFFGAKGDEAEVMAALRELLRAADGGDAPLILVTHQVVVTAATGAFVSSGEGIVARIEADGSVTPLGSLDVGR